MDEDLRLALELSCQDETDDDASIALALQLQDELDRRPTARKKQQSTNEKVQLVRREDFPALSSRLRDDDDDEDVAEEGGGETILNAEGIVVDPRAGNGLIGRREDGSLVSKHDAAIDARLKAMALQDTFDGAAGDLSDQMRVPGRVYNDLVRKQNQRKQ